MRSAVLVLSSLAGGMPARRAVTQLDPQATAQAQQRDATATRALSNVQIQTGGGQCLFVDELSGDSRANLTPVQVAACGATAGQGWDVITAGRHIAGDGQRGAALIVSTLTQACLNYDPRRRPGDQVVLFSCGGRADGGGEATSSQLFAFASAGRPGAVSLVPENGEHDNIDKCLTSAAQRVDVAACVDGADDQRFTFGRL